METITRGKWTGHLGMLLAPRELEALLWVAQDLTTKEIARLMEVSPGVVDAVCDIPHRWTIYLSVLCRTELGERYHKSIEVAPQGNYRADHLTNVIEITYADLRATVNPNHLVAAGWIAIPTDTTLDEAEAAKIFAAVGAWNQQKAA